MTELENPNGLPCVPEYPGSEWYPTTDLYWTGGNILVDGPPESALNPSYYLSNLNMAAVAEEDSCLPNIPLKESDVAAEALGAHVHPQDRQILYRRIPGGKQQILVEIYGVDGSLIEERGSTRKAHFIILFASCFRIIDVFLQNVSSS